MKLALDIKDVFGTISPPPQLSPFIARGGQGAGGISLFLNNLIILIYVIASIIFVFMIIWGAVEWIMSGGNKESYTNAKNRIVHAIIGIVLLAISFAILSLIGSFLGFQFFNPPTSSSSCVFFPGRC